MGIVRHEFPILEYDTDMDAVIMPCHDGLDIRLPEKAVFAFLGDAVERYAMRHNASEIGRFVSATKEYPMYGMDVCGRTLCLMQAPVGAAPAAQILDRMIGYGARKIISGGFLRRAHGV
jgi:hypothetical protein